MCRVWKEWGGNVEVSLVKRAVQMDSAPVRAGSYSSCCSFHAGGIVSCHSSSGSLLLSVVLEAPFARRETRGARRGDGGETKTMMFILYISPQHMGILCLVLCREIQPIRIKIKTNERYLFYDWVIMISTPEAVIRACVLNYVFYSGISWFPVNSRRGCCSLELA